MLFRGFFSTIPILIAIICGYIAGVFTGVIKMETIVDALHTSIISIPNFQTPKFDINAILIILPVILVIANEHIGHQLVTGKVIGRDLLKDPGLHRSLFADNFSTMISALSTRCRPPPTARISALWPILCVLRAALSA